MPDAVVLAAAVAVAWLPGLALLHALAVAPALIRLAVAPAASVAVAGLVAVLAAVTHVRFGPVPLGVATVLLAGVALARRLRSPERWRFPLPRRGSVPVLVGALMIAVGAGFACWSWLEGLGGLATPPQEHDMIIHVMQAAYITRSGNAAPWQLMPADVLTGQPVWFYPSGTHLLAAVTAGLTGGGVVAAINAMTVVLLAIAVCVGVAALGATAARQWGMGRGSAMLAGGVASLVMGGMYRPAFHLMHDGGILGNAVSISLVPGVVAGVLALTWMRARAGAAMGASAAGVAWCHPSGAISIAVTVLAWWVGQVLSGPGRAQLLRAARGLAVAAPVGLLVVLPVVLPGLSEAGRTGNWPPDTAPVPFFTAVGETFGFPYSGWIDQGQSRSQVWVLLLLVLGVGAAIALRRGLGPVFAFGVWSSIVMAAWLSPATGLETVVTQFYYRAMLRTWSHLSLLAAVLAGIGVVLVANRLAVLLARRRVPLRPAWVALGLSTIAFASYAALPAVGYAEINETAVATRYKMPDFVRVGPDDQRAIAWLADRIRPGERVFNSPNDGSTYLYVERGIPVVNVYTLGLAGVPYTYRLLEKFNTYPTDPAVRQELVDLNVRWVYVDSRPPRIGSVGSPEDWAGEDGFELAPGLAGLDRLPGIQPAFRAGSVTVYSLDLAAATPRLGGE